MKKRFPKKLNQYRVRRGYLASDNSYEFCGLFQIPFEPTGSILTVIASDGSDWDRERMGSQVWEHVSVSLGKRCPVWSEMDFIKKTFWADDETVVQFHVPKQSHIDLHPFCLHLWRPTDADFPRPPIEAV